MLEYRVALYPDLILNLTLNVATPQPCTCQKPKLNNELAVALKTVGVILV